MEQMRMKHNETGRSMVEMLGVLAIMGVLSLTAIAGITYAMRRQAVVDTVDLINKSSAGILTSGFLKEGTEDEEELPEGMVDSEQIPLNVYMSNVTLTLAAEKDVYGNETFVGPRGSVFSAYPSAVQGGGFLLVVNNMQSAVCEDVLSYDLEYDAVVRVGADGQLGRDFVDARDLDDAPKRKDFCRLGEDEEALNVGFVFNKISPDDDGSNQPKCNEACSVAALGECVLTTEGTCSGTNSDRKYYDLDHCTCLCLDRLNMDSECNCQNNLVWDESTKKCVQCLDNSSCSGNTPMCNGDTNTCEACPTNTPVWNDVDKKCEACPTSEPVWDSTNGVCVQCLTNTDCTDSTEPLCDAGTCVACPTSEPVWNDVDKKCEACPNGTGWSSSNKECESILNKECRTNGDCNNGSETGDYYCKNPVGCTQAVGTCERATLYNNEASINVHGKAVYRSADYMSWHAAKNFCAARNMSLFNPNPYCTANEWSSIQSNGWGNCTNLNVTNDYGWYGWTGSASGSCSAFCVNFYLGTVGSFIFASYDPYYVSALCMK